MPRYRVEYLGFNDGLPYEDFTIDDLEEAKAEFDNACTRQPRVGHRLIEVLEERGPLND